MIAQRTPPIGLRTLDDPGSNGIEIHIGQQIDQGSAVLNDQRFEPISPEIPLSAMTFVIETGEPLLDILDEFGKR
jgi:hypothetical protein